MITACPLCGGLLKPALVAPDRRFGGAVGYTVWRCQGCGCGCTAETSETAAANPYPPAYQPYHQVSRAAHGPRARVAALALAGFGYRRAGLPPLARALAAVRGWTWQPPPPPPGRLLDVGCGSGAYGASLIRLGWQADGIEPDANAAARARAAGLTVHTGDLHTCDLPPAAYDAITLWHVLEHLSDDNGVADPVAALRRLRPALKPGGLLIVEVPNFASLGARLTGGYWFHLDLPRHRMHFTPAALIRALHLAGFSTLRLRHIPNPHGLAGAIAYRRGQDYRRNPLNQALGWTFGLLSAALHRGDVIRVTAVGW